MLEGEEKVGETAEHADKHYQVGQRRREVESPLVDHDQGQDGVVNLGEKVAVQEGDHSQAGGGPDDKSQRPARYPSALGRQTHEQQNAQNKQIEIQGNQQVSMAQIQLDNKKIDLETEKFIRAGNAKFNVDAAKIDQNQQTIDLKADDQRFNQMKDILEGQQQQVNDAVKNIQALGDTDQFDYDPETQELIKRA